MNNFHEILINQLAKESSFVTDDGELKKFIIIDAAFNMNRKLIELLLEVPEIKQKFFTEISGHWVFDINLFVQYMENKKFLKDSYTRFRNKIGLNIGGKFLNQRNEVSLVWPFKDCILEGGQSREDQKRPEIFFNEILAQEEIDQLTEPKVLTNWKRFTVEGEKPVTKLKRENGTIKENLIIKGNNLLALHSLLPQFEEKVKLIYIDPPYNTGGSTDTFKYNNSFKHSTWLTFIKNRIDIAKRFLRKDGFIAITIDHEELFYLGAIADEIFGRENRIGIVSILINPKGRQHEKFFSASTEYMLVYAKDVNSAEFNKVTIEESKSEKFNLSDENGKYRLDSFIRARSSTTREKKEDSFYPIYVSKDLKTLTLEKTKDYYEVFPIVNGVEYTWKTQKDTFEIRNKENQYVAELVDDKVQIFNKYPEQQVFKNIWYDKKYFPEFQGTNLLKKLFNDNVFSYPKSLYAVYDTLKIMTDEEDIILDFFAGSGTTGHATLELNKNEGGNRQFILIEQLDYAENVTAKRIEIVIKNNAEENKMFSNSQDVSCVYLELNKYNQTFIEQIEEAKTGEQLLAIWGEMKEHSFLNYNVDIKKHEEAIEDFKQLSIETQKQHLCEILNKNQLYVNLSSIDDEDYQVSEDDKRLTRDFYEIKEEKEVIQTKADL
jgi:adenine-specific DNA-methyltransferase